MNISSLPAAMPWPKGCWSPREMPHAETLYIMQLMDNLRKKWGVCYPMD